MSSDIHNILKQFWGYDSFRPLQEEIIRSSMSKKDTLALLPTGGGKSICFQVPALAMEGICIVISPLIALMQDQVDNLNKRGIKAIAIHSGLSKREIDILLDNCIYGPIKFLYISPERLKSELFITRAKKMNICLLAIDESHCISQWGYDFRPAYLEIATFREIIPSVPVLALTATATPKVVIDIQEKLLFKRPNIFQKSFERKNLHYLVLAEEDKQGRMLKIIKKVQGAGVIYVRNRRKTQEIAQLLKNRNISADFYHAGLTSEQRSLKQRNWIENKTRIIVSTNAFGMGIDKPDVRFVINLGLPDSLEAYFQEAGRGGRDEQTAYAVLIVNEGDRRDLLSSVDNKFPSIDIIKNVYFALGNHFRVAIGAGEGISFPLDVEEIKKQTDISLLDIHYSLLFLERAGYINLSEAFHTPSRVKIEMKNDELYEFQVRNKKFASYIKLILRSYGGLFESYSKIKESELAKRAGQNVQTIKNILTELKQMDVISYEPATDLPFVTFLTPRIDIKHLRIGKDVYENRKKDALAKAEQVIHYAFSKFDCRSGILLSYFGEKGATDCGHCDICLKKNKKSVKLKSVEDEILLNLEMKNMDSQQLIDLLNNQFEEQNIKKSINWLLSCNKIRINELNLLTLVK